MRNLWIIALNAFRESIRDKILYNLVLLGLGMILFSIMLGEWSVFAREKVIQDFTLAIMSISGLLMAIFLGIGLIQKELQRKTVLTLLAKPMPRWHFILGKYVGLLMVLAVNLSVMSLCFYFVLWFTDSHPYWSLFSAIYLIYLEMALIVAVALLFSSFSTPTLGAIFTLGVYVAGHLSGDILNHFTFAQKHAGMLPGNPTYPTWVLKFIKGAYYFMPNLENFNIKGRVVYDLPIPQHYVLWTSAYGLFYIALLLFVTCAWFNKRDFI